MIDKDDVLLTKWVSGLWTGVGAYLCTVSFMAEDWIWTLISMVLCGGCAIAFVHASRLLETK